MKKVVQTYVFGPRGAFFVSTAERSSDCAAAPELTHHETLWWEWDPDTRSRGKMAQGYLTPTSVEGAYAYHSSVCAALLHGEEPE